MEVSWFKHLPSTHKYLIDKIKNDGLSTPLAIGVDFQSEGVGSRGNKWEGDEGNLYLSFCVEEKQLPKDLQLASCSIYFAWLMKEVLVQLGSKAWLKWPNDFYIKNKKIGGVITTKAKDMIIGSIGINLAHAPEDFSTLDVQISPRHLLALFLEKLEKNISWKDVFSKYKLEFQLSGDFSFHLGEKRYSLSQATLLDDGSIKIESKKVYSLR